MNLLESIKQKNHELQKNVAATEALLRERVANPSARSFGITFVVTPFVIGAGAQFLFGSKWSATHYFRRLILPRLRLLPFF